MLLLRLVGHRLTMIMRDYFIKIEATFSLRTTMLLYSALSLITDAAI